MMREQRPLTKNVIYQPNHFLLEVLNVQQGYRVILIYSPNQNFRTKAFNSLKELRTTLIQKVTKRLLEYFGYLLQRLQCRQ